MGGKGQGLQREDVEEGKLITPAGFLLGVGGQSSYRSSIQGKGRFQRVKVTVRFFFCIGGALGPWVTVSVIQKEQHEP